MKSEAPPRTDAARVRYRENQTLDAVDLADEQAALLALRRRHHLGHHTWGVVVGLELHEDGMGFSLQPGFATDGYGRELVVPAPLALPRKTLDGVGFPVDVFLLYRLLPDDIGRPAAASTDPAHAGRRRERAYVRLAKAADPPPGSNVPGCDPAAALITTDDPAREWPVFLGSLKKPETVKPLELPVDIAHVRRATLRGEAIVASSGSARLRVGLPDEGPVPAFAVGVTPPPPARAASDAPAAGASPTATAPAEPPFREALVVYGVGPDGFSRVTMAHGLYLGDPSVPDDTVPTPAAVRPVQRQAAAPPVFREGVLRLDSHDRPDHRRRPDGTPERESGALVFDPPAAGPVSPLLRGVYRLRVPAEPPTDPPTDQLRVQIFNPKEQGDPAKHRVVIRGYDMGIDPSEYTVHVVDWGNGPTVSPAAKDEIYLGTDAAGTLHVRVYDARGTLLRDADESRLADREEALAVVKGRVAAWGPTHALTDSEELRLAGEVLILVDLLRPVAPVLTVAADGTVTIGNPDRPPPSGPVLRVLGQLLEGPVEPNANDPRFLNQVRSNLLQAAFGAGSNVLPLLSVKVTGDYKESGATKTLTLTVSLTNQGQADVTNVEVRGTASYSVNNQASTQVVKFDGVTVRRGATPVLLSQAVTVAAKPEQLQASVTALGVVSSEGVLAFGTYADAVPLTAT